MFLKCCNRAWRRIMPWKTLLIIALVLVLGWAATMAVLSLLARPPEGLGVRDGKLAACPDTPNCVCSQAQAGDEEHAGEPIRFDGKPDEAWKRLRQLLSKQPRTRIVA